MLPSATCNLCSLPLSCEWIGIFSYKDAVTMGAFVSRGIELCYKCWSVILFSGNVNLSLFVFWSVSNNTLEQSHLPPLWQRRGKVNPQWNVIMCQEHLFAPKPLFFLAPHSVIGYSLYLIQNFFFDLCAIIGF